MGKILNAITGKKDDDKKDGAKETDEKEAPVQEESKTEHKPIDFVTRLRQIFSAAGYSKIEVLKVGKKICVSLYPTTIDVKVVLREAEISHGEISEITGGGIIVRDLKA